MAKNICLHVGAHKSASTTIQRNCRSNLDRIYQQLDLRYISASVDVYPFLFLFPQIASNLIDFRDERVLSQHIEPAKELFNEMLNEYPDDDNIFISWEGFLGHCGMQKYGSLYPYTPYYFKALRGMTEDHNVKVIFIIRRQDTFIESCYLQQIKERHCLTFRDYMQAIDLQNFSWLRIANDTGESMR